MQLTEILRSRKKAILSNWRKRIIATYPEDAHSFLNDQKDRFANPIGAAIRHGTETLYEGVINCSDRECLCGALEDLVKIRSVQEFSPSRAVSFVLLLKPAVRDEIGSEIGRGDQLEVQLLDLYSRIDELLLLAFDSYTDCREKIYNIRVNELKNSSALAYRRLNRPVKKQKDNDESRES